MLPTDNSTAATMKQVRFQNWTESKSVTIADVSATNLEYTLSEDGTLTISGFGNMPEFSSVEKIPWYSDRDKIKKVVITGVTSVSNHAFTDCVNLEEVVFPEQFEKVGDSAFSGCIKLPEINLNQAKELKSIDNNAFFNCISLSKVTFPESIVSVGENAFSVDADTYQEIRERTDVYYDGSIEKWLKISFGDSKSFKVSDATSNPMYLSGGNLYVNGSKLVTELNTQESSSTVIGRNVFAGCLSLTKVNLTGVTDIGTNAFYNCSSVKKLTWESSVSVAMGAFQSDTSLKEIVISGNATGVGNYTFSGCTSLENISLPDSVNSFGLSVFSGCTNLKKIRLSSGLSDLGKSCFNNCTSLGSISFMGKACPTIASDAFNNVKSASVLVYIPEKATGYAENESIRQIASHLFSTKVIVSDCTLPRTEQYTCLLHENCEEDCCEEIVQTKDHQPGEPVSENVVPATYEQEGSYEEVCYCSVCKKELSREKKTIEKLTKENSIISNGGGQSVTDIEKDINH